MPVAEVKGDQAGPKKGRGSKEPKDDRKGSSPTKKVGDETSTMGDQDSKMASGTPASPAPLEHSDIIKSVISDSKTEAPETPAPVYEEPPLNNIIVLKWV